MSYISTAIGTERRSRTSGYAIKKGFFSNETPNLPQVIAIFGEANTSNQSTINGDKREVTSSEEAGRIYGYGSPIHQILRILRPVGADGVGGIPTIVFPQIAGGTDTATVFKFTVTGSATKSVTHLVRICGRENLDFESYSFNVLKNDTPTQIAQKIADVINKNLSCPVSASAALGVVTITSKWKGATSAQIDIIISNEGQASGVTYLQTEKTDGVGTPSIANALTQFGSDWITCVVNPYGELMFDLLEQFNGTPAVENASGRYSATVFRPFMSFFGSTENDYQELSSLTDQEERVNQVTNVLCPAPNSKGLPWEAAANVVRLFARTMQDTPEIDVCGMLYPDMPVPIDGNIGSMSEYNNRDFLVKRGCSTVILNKGAYEIQDLVTTYHPEAENPLQFNYCRNLNLDWNVCDSYRILETLKVKDKVLVKDDQITTSRVAIKPKQWKAILYKLFDDLAVKALINEPEFSKQSLQVAVSTINPNRFETFFRYKRTGIARIESTTAEAGF